LRHVTVYREEGRYAGWPANYGIWSWGDEIVVGFTLGYPKLNGGFHARDRDRPFVTMQGRSLDGGESWRVQRTPCRTPGNRALSADEHMRPGLRIAEVLTPDSVPICPGGIRFIETNFALMCARSGLTKGTRSWFYTSYDRCGSWDGPYQIPLLGGVGVAARTDYIIDGPGECTFFLTSAKSDGNEGRVFCARTTDGGKNIRFLSWIGPEPRGFAIMPASVRLSPSRILVAVRCREEGRNWIDLYGTDDNAETWSFLNTPVRNTGAGGNPPALARLDDGRLCLVYGYRDPPSGIRARVSGDEGETWGEELILRDDGGNHDIGYPRTVMRADGSLVIVYYFNDRPEGERYIAATIWAP
jgi:hypothetical protein